MLFLNPMLLLLLHQLPVVAYCCSYYCSPRRTITSAFDISTATDAAAAVRPTACTDRPTAAGYYSSTATYSSTASLMLFLLLGLVLTLLLL